MRLDLELVLDYTL